MAASDIVWDPNSKPASLHAGFTTAPELLEDVSLPVTGKIPSYVNGRLFRNGPGLYEVTHKSGETTHFNHWFDGIATVHRFRIDGRAGTVQYKNRRTMPDVAQAAADAPSKAAYKTMLFGEQDPCRGLLGNMFQLWRPYSKPAGSTRTPTNVNVTLERVPGVGALVARSDVNRSAVLDIDSLEVTRRLTYATLNPRLGKTFTAAHSASDPDTGEHFNFCYSIGPGLVDYTVFALAPSGESRVLATIPEHPRYLHSLAATKHYVVLITYAAVPSLWKLATGAAFATSLEPRPDLRTKFYLISRESGGVAAVYETDPFFCFHTINAFEDDTGDVAVDLARLDDCRVVQQYYRSLLARQPASFFDEAVPTRFRLRGVARAAAAYAADGAAVVQAEVRRLGDANMELPCISPRFQMRTHRFAYGVNSQPGPSPFNALVKVDAASGAHTLWHAPDAACGEPIFVPSPEGGAEDDGVLLSVVLDKLEQRSFLLVLDARSMTEVARATVPQPVPLGFHGQYMSEEFARGPGLA